MKKINVVSIEDRFLGQKIYYTKNKKKYISFLFIFPLLFLSIYLAIKFFNCQTNKDIIHKYKSEEGKIQDAPYKKINNNSDYISFNNIETKDLNILRL